MDVAYELTPLVASKLIVYTFGALIHLFLMVLILGNRRLRRLEWLLFALMVALFMWYSGNLLALNTDLYYGVAPHLLSGLARIITFLGLVAIAPLLVHAHTEYLSRLQPTRSWQKLLAASFYIPLVAPPWLAKSLLDHLERDPVAALGGAALMLVAWIIAALLASSAINFSVVLRRQIEAPNLLRLHTWVAGIQALLAVGLAWAYLLRPLSGAGLGGYLPVFLMLLAVVPSGLMGYSIFRYNFLDLRVQRNVAYSVVVIFALLIYVDFMRRLSGWLEEREILPASVTEGVLIFILVIFLDPVKRFIDRVLHAAFVSELEKVQKLMNEIQEQAKQTGDIETVRRFVEGRVSKELGLENVELRMKREDSNSRGHLRGPKVRVLPVVRGGEEIAELAVLPATADLSGDQLANLRFLADQLPAALELCQLIADKVKLERELAEKAKLAFLGEMAARIAHNVKNPLSSMKTLVQLLEEDASLPERVRGDCRLVVGEIDRLNHNISQVLRYAKPARDTDRPVDLATVVQRVLALARAESERRQVKLEVETVVPCAVEGGEEAASDIASNLIVNALEVSSAGDTIRIRIEHDSRAADRVEFIVEDQGPGISTELRARIFEPFFTTRPGGTGLGLAIVKRRVEEIRGAIECISPIDDGQSGQGRTGSRFSVQFRAAAKWQT